MSITTKQKPLSVVSRNNELRILIDKLNRWLLEYKDNMDELQDQIDDITVFDPETLTVGQVNGDWDLTYSDAGVITVDG